MGKIGYLLLGMTLVFTMIGCRERDGMSHNESSHTGTIEKFGKPEQQPYYFHYPL